MGRIVSHIGDRVLGRLLRQADAGACVKNYGLACGCAGVRLRQINCTGSCVPTAHLCF